MKEVDDGYFWGSIQEPPKKIEIENKRNETIEFNFHNLCIELKDNEHILIIERFKDFINFVEYNFMEKQTRSIHTFFKKDLHEESIFIKDKKLFICDTVFFDFKKDSIKHKVYNQGIIFYNIKEQIIKFSFCKKKIDNIKF